MKYKQIELTPEQLDLACLIIGNYIKWDASSKKILKSSQGLLAALKGEEGEVEEDATTQPEQFEFNFITETN